MLCDGHWHGHAWVVCDATLIDITADQFGLPPVSLTSSSDPRYRAGPDSATPAAIAQRQHLVRAALATWHSTAR